MADVVGEMYGERAVQAQFGAIVTGAGEIDGVKRAKFGGIILADIGTDNWQRWRGTMILIPRMIDRERNPCNGQLQHMMVNWLGHECEEVKRPPRDSFWVPEWRAVSSGERQ